MISNPKFISTAKKLFLVAVTLFGLTQCSDEEVIPSQAAAATDEAQVATSTETPTVLSLTVNGYYKIVSPEECKTCKFVVPANTTVIDGQKLDIKPGEAICLDAAIKYGALEFINLQGDDENPTLIAYRAPEVKEELTEDATSL